MLQMNFPNRKKKRYGQAMERQLKWDSFSPAQKMQELDSRFGEGIGATRQREKLLLTQFQRQPATQG